MSQAQHKGRKRKADDAKGSESKRSKVEPKKTRAPITLGAYLKKQGQSINKIRAFIERGDDPRPYMDKLITTLISPYDDKEGYALSKELILKYGAIDSPSLLRKAVCKRDTELVKVLAPHVTNTKELSFALALYATDEALASALVAQGADPTRALSMLIKDRRQPDTAVVTSLMDRGVNVNQVMKSCRSKIGVETLLAHGADKKMALLNVLEHKIIEVDVKELALQLTVEDLVHIIRTRPQVGPVKQVNDLLDALMQLTGDTLEDLVSKFSGVWHIVRVIVDRLCSNATV